MWNQCSGTPKFFLIFFNFYFVVFMLVAVIHLGGILVFEEVIVYENFFDFHNFLGYFFYLMTAFCHGN